MICNIAFSHRSPNNITFTAYQSWAATLAVVKLVVGLDLLVSKICKNYSNFLLFKSLLGFQIN